MKKEQPGTGSALTSSPRFRLSLKRATSIITNSAPLGFYGRNMPGPYGGPKWGAVSYERGTHVGSTSERIGNNLKRFTLLFEKHCQNLALTVLYVLYPLDSGTVQD